MPARIGFFADDLGALRIDHIVLGAAALLLLTMIGHELFRAGVDALNVRVGPGPAAVDAALDVAAAEKTIR